MRYFFIILIAISVNLADAQFLGGNGDGYSIAFYVNSTSISLGGNDDGYDQAIFTNPTSIFLGGANDGYDQAVFTNTTSIYLGGNNDGQDLAEYDSPTSISRGGAEDGYNSVDNLLVFEWTGAIGTGWNVGGNWSDGVIPTIGSRVLIPAGVPNFPFVNAGLMSIGLDVNGGTFLARSIKIESGAEMTLRVNALLENYGTITIEGTLFVLNNVFNAIQNLSGGLIEIHANGVLEWQ